MAKKNGTKRTINITIIVGLILMSLSFLLYKFNEFSPFLNTWQPEFGSAGIILIVVGLVWKTTKIKIST